MAALALMGTVLAPVVAGAVPIPAGPALGSGPLLPLSGSATPLPKGAVELGPAASSATVTADVVLRPRDPVSLAAFALDVSTPGNPRYHRYLPAGHLDAAFGPTQATQLATRAWLTSRGLRVGPTSADGLLIPVSGSVATMESAFAVPLVRARMSDGRTARLATTGPRMPATLVPEVQGVIGLSDQAVAFPHLSSPTPLLMPGQASPAPAESSDGAVQQASAVGPQACSTITYHPGQNAWTATQLAATYGISQLYAAGRIGAGQTVGIFELENYTASDIATYQSCYGTRVPVSDTLIDGGAGTTTQTGEAALDIEVVAGLAPGAHIHVYTGPNNGGNGPLDIYNRMVTDDTSKVISTSWGQCEPLMGSDAAQAVAAQMAEQTVFQMAASQGQTVLAASGDAGSTDCFPGNASTAVAVDDPAAQPDVTGVGGTTLSNVKPNDPTEVAWGGSNSAGGAGGGGNSITFVAPAWQQVAAAQSGLTSYTCGSHANQQCREVPDVSASADRSYGDIIYFQGYWYVYGGTSMAAPMWAALIADIDQGCTAPAGLLGPTLYAPGSTAGFHDVTSGDNADPGLSGVTSFPATAGYDMATGWGSPDAGVLLGLLTGTASGCPAISKLTPSSGASRGGTKVVVSGSGFGSASPTVAFAGVRATVKTWNTDGDSVTVVAPAGTPGTANVTVSNAASPGAGTSAATSDSTYTYIAPKVSNVTPARGPTTGGGTVTITGTEFVGVQSVAFGGVDAAFHVETGERMTAVVPAMPHGGLVNVIVSATSGTSLATASDRYLYALPGYWMVASDGGLFSFASAGFFGSAGDITLNKPIVGMAPTSDDRGYWLVASDGGIFSYGDAPFYGSTGNLTLNKPIVGMAPTRDGGGYWLVASDGGIFSYGDAGFYGSTGGRTLNKPIVGMAPTPNGGGYWLVASDGGIFAFGDAKFYGSTGNLTLNKPIVGMAPTPTGGGYWLVASDGGIFAFGDAPFCGSTGAMTLNRPVVGMAVDLTGGGYWLVASDGGIFAFGDAPFYGSTGNITLNKPVVGMSST